MYCTLVNTTCTRTVRTEHSGRQVGGERDGDEEALEEPDDHNAARAPAVRRHARHACAPEQSSPDRQAVSLVSAAQCSAHPERRAPS